MISDLIYIQMIKPSLAQQRMFLRKVIHSVLPLCDFPRDPYADPDAARHRLQGNTSQNKKLFGELAIGTFHCNNRNTLCNCTEDSCHCLKPRTFTMSDTSGRYFLLHYKEGGGGGFGVQSIWRW